MGLHTGTPTLTSEGYVGVDVHRGARVAALAPAVRCSSPEATATLVGGEPLTDLGRHRLKDFDGPARLFQLGMGSPPARPDARGRGSSRPRLPGSSVVSTSSTTRYRSWLTEAPPILTGHRARRHRQDPLLDRAVPSPRGGRRGRHGLRPARRAPRSDARSAGDRGTPSVRGRRLAGGDRRTDRRAAHLPAPGQRRATTPGGGGEPRVPCRRTPRRSGSS